MRIEGGQWEPATFSSSRRNKSNFRQKKVEEFMDADDGLLGGTLLQRDDFDIMLKNAKTKGKNVSYWHLLLC